MNSSTINPAWSTRRPILYETWLAVRDERNALALQVDRQAARIRELQAVIQAQRAQLLSAGASMSYSAQVRSEIELLTREAPHE
jgi:hypothetical protein